MPVWNFHDPCVRHIPPELLDAVQAPGSLESFDEVNHPRLLLLGHVSRGEEVRIVLESIDVQYRRADFCILQHITGRSLCKSFANLLRHLIYYFAVRANLDIM